jgi:hypothetical protein
MPEADLQTPIRNHSDIDWLEEEAWRRASKWTITPQLLFAMMDLVAEEASGKE